MIYLGADHAGYKLKEKIKKHLDSKKIKYQDLGTDSEESVDASDYAIKVSQKVKKNKKDRGILICGSGVMMSMAANRAKARAALAWTPEIIKEAREHSDVNILVLAGRESVPKNWKKIIDLFLTTKKLSKVHYLRRIQKLDTIK